MATIRARTRLWEWTQLIPKRRFHAYGVGAAKSGTHSIAAIFSRSYRSAHEAEHMRMIRLIFEDPAMPGYDDRVKEFLLKRDRRLRLEMDCSQLNAAFVSTLAGLFPDAKFILTIRDVYGFVNSAINQQLGRGLSKTWRKLSDLRYGGYPYSHHDAPLEQRGLYPLDGYLSYWTRHNEGVLRDVPEGQLLVVCTREILQSLSQISEFLGIPADSLDASQAHSYPAAAHFNVLHELDPQYVEARVHAHCDSLMSRFYPEVNAAQVMAKKIA